MPLDDPSYADRRAEFKAKVEAMVRGVETGPLDDLNAMMDRAVGYVRAAKRSIGLGLRFYTTYTEDTADEIPPKVSRRLGKIVALCEKDELTEVECMDLAAHCCRVLTYGLEDLADRLLPLMGKDLVAVLRTLGILVL